MEEKKRTLSWASGSDQPHQEKAKQDFDAALGDLVRELASVPPPVTTPAETTPPELPEGAYQDATGDLDDKTVIDSRMASSFSAPVGSPAASKPARRPGTAPLGTRSRQPVVIPRKKVATAPRVSPPTQTTADTARTVTPYGLHAMADAETKVPRSPMFFIVIAVLVGAGAASAVFWLWTTWRSQSEPVPVVEVKTPAPVAPVVATPPAPPPQIAQPQVPAPDPATPSPPVFVPPPAAPIPIATPIVERPQPKASAKKAASRPAAKTSTKESDNPYEDSPYDAPSPKKPAKQKPQTSEWESPY